MKIRKATPPTAAPMRFLDLLSGFRGLMEKGITEQLENEIREYFQADHVFFLSSGKAALFLILSALKELGNRERVIIPAYTCYSVPSAIRKAGLEIVPCDIMADTLDFDPDQLEGLCDHNTLCIVPTHLFGIPSDVTRVREIAGKKDIYIVEDVAQAMGVFHGKEKLGTLGDVAFFSFGRGKNITCGSGGLIITSSKEIAGKIRSLYDLLFPEPIKETSRTFLEVCFLKIFLSPYLYWLPDGLPFLKIGETKYYTEFPVYRMGGFKAGLLRDWKSKLEMQNDIRRSTTTGYIDILGLNKDIGIYSNAFPCLRFPVFFRDPSGKEAACESFRHLGVSPMYPTPVNGIREIRGCFNGATYPNAENIVKSMATLPTHSLVSGSARDSLCAGINEFLDIRYRNGA
jgi:dTDP-4-amino-4,6-dideoxygalactose transaminase